MNFFSTVNVTLNLYTAHPELILSEGNKCVTHGNVCNQMSHRDLTDCSMFQARRGSSQGGGSKRSAWGEDRKGSRYFQGQCEGVIFVSPEDGFGYLVAMDMSMAITSPPSLLPEGGHRISQRSISLDYVFGLLSFYNMTKCLIYTFPPIFFSETLYSLFILWPPNVGSPDTVPAPRGDSATPPGKTTALASVN